jgi:2-methylcitrate dehydratase PrpD
MTQEEKHSSSPSIIEQLLDMASIPSTDLPQTVRHYAELSLFDWLVVADAGKAEPLSNKIRDFVLMEQGREAATVFGATRKVPPRAAALANGTTSHALDYDDTHFAHVGHPSVAIYPAALAAGEDVDACLRDVTAAFLLGAEASCRLGMVLGRDHYERGFHQTATAGAFGAAIAAGRLYGLSRDQMRHALGLVSTRASGLKSQFGSMGKPYNAGIAAANGVEAALLARSGFISCQDGVSGQQGFIDTHVSSPNLAALSIPLPPGHFVFEDIKYKFHACCHGTHAMIEAVNRLRRGHMNFKVRRIEVTTNSRWLKVCDIKSPRTGLEVKFSYAWLAAMTLSGLDTASEKIYVDGLCANVELAVIARCVAVRGDAAMPDMMCDVRIAWDDGTEQEARYDLAQKSSLAEMEQRLRAKACTLIGPERSDVFWIMATSGSTPARDLGCTAIRRLS